MIITSICYVMCDISRELIEDQTTTLRVSFNDYNASIYKSRFMLKTQ